MRARYLAAPALMILFGFAKEASAQVQRSPFSPGGPLAPWRPPLSAPSTASTFGYAPASGALVAPADSWALSNSAGQASMGPAQSWPQRNPQADSGPKPQPAQESDARTYVSLIGNPALAPWGKIGGRLEIAPLAAHALFFEYSKIDFPIKELNREVPIYEYDLGYHLFPFGHGASGFYLGPRLIFLRGEVTEAVGRGSGAGGDIGYQFVIAHHLVINLGIGAVRFTASAEAKPEYVNKATAGLPPETKGLVAGELSFDRSITQWLPLATTGLGVAF